MASAVDICNLALGHIGNKPITSLEGSSASAIRCNQFFSVARDAVLRDHNWNWATRIELLAEISDEEILGWDYLYTYPARCLKVRSVFDESNVETQDENPQKHRELITPTSNQKCIATNFESAYAEYTYQVTDTTLFDSQFVEALSYKLASMMAKPLSGNDTLGMNLLKVYGDLIGRAKAIDKSEGYKKPGRVSPYADARG